MRIAAYCRVSTEKEEQIESLKNQMEFFNDFAVKYNHKLVRIYADEGISGKQMANRVEFMRMLEDSRNNLFDMVVVKDISRFARNTVDFLTAIRELRDRGIEVQFLSNSQTILGNSEFILTIFSAMAQEESANLSKRVKFGKKVNAKKGRVPNIIYGYDKIDTFTLAINAEEADTVKNIFDMYCNEGCGTRKIANTLNQASIPSKKGTKWTPKTIRRIISNPVYKGILINNKIETVDFLSGKRQAVPDSEHFIHMRPELRIISDEQFDLAQNQMTMRQKMYRNENSTGKYSNKHLFSTLIKCAHCGHTFTRKKYTYKNTYIRWRCSGNDLYTKGFCENNFSVDEQALTVKIEEYLKEVIGNHDEFAESIITSYNDRLFARDNRTNLSSLAKKSEKLISRKDRYKKMYINDIISINELKTKCGEIDNEINALNSRISEFGNLISEAEINKDSVSVNNFLSLNEYTNSDIRKIIEKITVYKTGEIYICFKNIKEI